MAVGGLDHISVPSVEGGMLICLYGEMRDALWPERGLSGSMARARRVWLCCPLFRRDGRFRVPRQTASPRASAAALRIAEMLAL